VAEVLSAELPNAVVADEGLLYFRRNDGSEIFSKDADGLEMVKMLRRGHQPLEQYGQFGSSVYYMDHPFEALFQAGGAHEMPVEQVIALGYAVSPPLVPTCGRHVGDAKDHLTHRGHPGGRNPRERGCWQGARPVHFPQLEGIVLEGPFECEHCERVDLPTTAALEQHARVMHSELRQRHDLADGIVAGLQRSGLTGGTSPEAIAAAVIAALRIMEQPKPDPEPTPEDDDDEDQPEAPELEPEDDDEDEPQPEPEPGAAEQVRSLREQGMSRAAVADQLSMSIGRVRYLESH
jgi:hypothetical protein